MKNNLLKLMAVFLLFLSKTTFSQSIPSYVPQNGLVGWWPFNGNANDESGNGNNGTVNGATLTTDRFGNNGKAHQFNGNSYIQVPNSNSLQVGDALSISVWLKYFSLQNNLNWILQKGVRGGCPKEGYNITIDNGFGQIPFVKGLAYGLGESYCANIGNQNRSLDSSWHNMVIIYNPPKGNRLFFDGIEVNRDYGVCDSCKIINSPSRPLYIGLSPQDGGAGWNGKLDDIAIWNRALSEDEIKNLYNANICYQNVTVTDTLLINMNITGFNPITYQNTIKIYPNPTQGNLTIDFGNISFLSGYQMKITNSVGQQVFQTNISQKISNVNLSSFTTKGIYYVQLIDSKGTVAETKKIVVQ